MWAEVAERQTQLTQNQPSESSCGFKSRLRHQNLLSVFEKGRRRVASFLCLKETDMIFKLKCDIGEIAFLNY